VATWLCTSCLSILRQVAASSIPHNQRQIGSDTWLTFVDYTVACILSGASLSSVELCESVHVADALNLLYTLRPMQLRRVTL